MTDLTRHALRAASFCVLAVLAACADGGEEAQTTAPETTSTQQQTAAAAPADPNAPQSRVNLAKCTEDAKGKVFFKVGTGSMGIPAPAIRDVIPSNLQPPLNKEQVRKELQKQAAAGGGCPGQPIPVSLLIVQDNLNHPLLDGRIGLLTTPPEGVTGPFARVTGDLQKNPTENCRQLGGGLMGCVGTENRGNVTTQVLYVIATDPSQRMASGGPLAARCVLKDRDVRGCNLVDQLPGNVAFDATLKAGTYTVDGLRGAREAAVARVNAFRQTR